MFHHFGHGKGAFAFVRARQGAGRQHIAQAGAVLGHHGQAMGLRFQIDHAKGLVHTGPEEQRRRAIGRSQRIAIKLPEQLHMRAKGGKQRFDLGAGGAVARHTELPVARPPATVEAL